MITLLSGLMGCASPPKPPSPTVVKVSINALSNVNPTAKGRASPVTVRIYGLKSPSTFNAVDFFTLFDKDKEILGTELMAREEIQMLPGQKSAELNLASPDIQYVGIIAAFRDIEHAKWRTVTAISQHKTTTVWVKLEGNTVNLRSESQ